MFSVLVARQLKFATPIGFALKKIAPRVALEEYVHDVGAGWRVAHEQLSI